MTQAEQNTSKDTNPQASNDAVFSMETRVKALEVLEKEHG